MQRWTLKTCLWTVWNCKMQWCERLNEMRCAMFYAMVLCINTQQHCPRHISPRGPIKAYIIMLIIRHLFFQNMPLKNLSQVLDRLQLTLISALFVEVTHLNWVGQFLLILKSDYERIYLIYLFQGKYLW